MTNKMAQKLKKAKNRRFNCRANEALKMVRAKDEMNARK